MPRAPFRAFRPSRPAHWGAITLGSVLLLLLILGSHSLGSPGRLLALTMAHPIVLRNSNGTEVDILPLGAIIQRLRVADRDGQVADVVLGFDSETPYRDGTSPYMGAVVGRVANRIAKGQFELDGVTYKLNINNGPNSLHGGKVGFDKRDFTVKAKEQGKSVLLEYVSPDGEENYPGTVTVSVLYELTDANELRVTMKASADKPTPINLAQHTYWNLGGHESGTILDHQLTIHGDHYTPVDETQIPTGEIVPVAGTPFDFTTAQPVGQRIAQTEGGYDHNYVLFGLGPAAKDRVKDGAAFSVPQPAITLVDPGSGRALEVCTTAPGVQVYSGNFLDGTLKGKAGVSYVKHAGLALETQGFPDAVNQPAFPSVILRPGHDYVHALVYRFYTV
ncbi:AEP1 [Auxenochlorella protothecoides x Auxenochlorella symbiontica]